MYYCVLLCTRIAYVRMHSHMYVYAQLRRGKETIARCVGIFLCMNYLHRVSIIEPSKTPLLLTLPDYNWLSFVPEALTIKAMVNPCLLLFPPLHIFPLSSNPESGRAC